MMPPGILAICSRIDMAFRVNVLVDGNAKQQFIQGGNYGGLKDENKVCVKL